MATVELSIDQEILLLQFWALSVEVARRIPADTCRAVGGLQAALDGAATIPVAIGWEDDVDAAAALTRPRQAPPARQSRR